MSRLPEDLPPRWRDNMQQRRACLLRYESEARLSRDRVRSIARELVARRGEGEWDCDVVQLDAAGRDWEFRFKPRVPPVHRPDRSSVG